MKQRLRSGATPRSPIVVAAHYCTGSLNRDGDANRVRGTARNNGSGNTFGVTITDNGNTSARPTVRSCASG